MQSAQVNQAYDEQYIKKGAEYIAYENWQAGANLLDSSRDDLEVAREQ